MSAKDLPLSARIEVTKKYAAAPKKAKGQILDQVVEVTGWNRDQARQQLTARFGNPRGAAATVAVIDLNRPGMSGDSVPWEGWSHVWEYVEEVSGRVA